jgi:hypothetical protein
LSITAASASEMLSAELLSAMDLRSEELIASCVAEYLDLKGSGAKKDRVQNTGSTKRLLRLLATTGPDFGLPGGSAW